MTGDPAPNYSGILVGVMQEKQCKCIRKDTKKNGIFILGVKSAIKKSHNNRTFSQQLDDL